MNKGLKWVKLKAVRRDEELLQKCRRVEGMVAGDGEERVTRCHNHHTRATGSVYQKAVIVCLERNVSMRG